MNAVRKVSTTIGELKERLFLSWGFDLKDFPVPTTPNALIKRRFKFQGLQHSPITLISHDKLERLFPQYNDSSSQYDVY
ncbi:hypothetical protein L6452_30369 [Arctium lappa]|uniref:Uncharacterized protein n=1 Tax=Arctium lappa TaxID=4217 RepID=A0ACB8ZI53_ARCLA|nr:hypothetical protein L6452_30369 [Arctium lappa]